MHGMTVEDLVPFPKENWLAIKNQLLAGTYPLKPVRRVEIPKPGGLIGLRGTPTVMGRLVRQTILEVLPLTFNMDFSGSSYGFRPSQRVERAVRRPGSTLPNDTDRSWTGTWRSRSTGSTTTCSCHV